MRHIKMEYDTVIVVHGDEIDGYYADDGDYIQASEITDVDFTMLEVDINSAKIEAIDKDIKKAMAGIEMLEQAKAELLAIPDMSAE